MLSGRFPIRAVLLVSAIALAASAGNAEEHYYAIEQPLPVSPDKEWSEKP